MFAGLMMTRLLKKSHLPDVTAYLIAGVLIGPCFIGALGIPGIGFESYEELEGVGLISDVALGFIAFSIGNEFRLSQLKETGKQALVIGILQAVTATVLVDIALLIFHFIRPDVLTVPAAITLGAIAAAIRRPLWLNQGFFTEDVDRLRYHELCLYFLMDFAGTDLLARGQSFRRDEGVHSHQFTCGVSRPAAGKERF